MFQSIKNGWELVKASWQVLLADRELIVFPIISFICLAIVSVSFIVPVTMTGLVDSANKGDVVSQIHGGILLFIFYVICYTIIFYFNTALIGSALIRLRGGDPTMKDGIKIANNHLDKIIGYALLAATVGMVLQWLRDRGAIGRWVASFVGLAWNIATFLVVPVLINENMGPIDAVKRSTELLKKTWGEQITGNVGIGIVFGVLTGLTAFLGGLFCILLANISMPLAVIAGVLTAAAVIVLSVLNFTLTGIYTASVYQYAVTGKTDKYFNQNQIMSAFKAK